MSQAALVQGGESEGAGLISWLLTGCGYIGSEDASKFTARSRGENAERNWNNGGEAAEHARR